MTRVEPAELQRVVHDYVPRMIVALGLPRSLARAIADRGCSSAAMRERLTIVREEAERLRDQHQAAAEPFDAARADLLVGLTRVLVTRLELQGHEPDARALLDHALALCAHWTLGEVAGRPLEPSALEQTWAGLVVRLLAGRRKPLPVP